MDSTTALSYGLPFPDGDLLMSNTSSSSSIFALSNSLPRSVWNTSTSVRGEVERGERGHDQVGGAARVGAVAGDAPVRQVDEQAHVRPLAADAHARQATGQVGARLVAVELAVEDAREPGLVNPRLVWFERSARVRARHAPPFHDVDDAPSGGGDAPPLQRGLDLPGTVTLMAVAPDRVHVAGDRVHPLGFGMPGHPVAGGAGNAQYPALRRYRITEALARITATFVRIPAPLVLKRPPPSPTVCCACAARPARSAQGCACRRLSWSRCCGCPGPNGAAWNARRRTRP